MESRIKGRVLAIIVAGAMIASTSTVLAATATPTPKPSAKATAKATLKPTPRASVKAKAKTTKKPAARRPSPRKVIYKRKVVKASPSPSPKWPPLGFRNPGNGEIYYRLPTGPELLGELSAAAALSEQFKTCAKLACGVVKVASTNGCTWWEIDSTVFGPLTATDPTKVPYGTLKTTSKGTDKRQIATVILISTEALKSNIGIGGLNINCHHDPVTASPQKVPSNIYTVSTPTPSPSASASSVSVTNTN